MLYPLSIGPAMVLILYSECDHTWARAYDPIFLICDAIGAKKALFAYINWWLDVGGTDSKFIG